MCSDVEMLFGKGYYDENFFVGLFLFFVYLCGYVMVYYVFVRVVDDIVDNE